MGERDRLRWRCRRGMLELDLLLSGFLERGYAGLNAEQRQAFERLLNTPDQELLEYLLGQRQAREGLQHELIQAIRHTAGP